MSLFFILVSSQADISLELLYVLVAWFQNLHIDHKGSFFKLFQNLISVYHSLLANSKMECLRSQNQVPFVGMEKIKKLFFHYVLTYQVIIAKQTSHYQTRNSQ